MQVNCNFQHSPVENGTQKLLQKSVHDTLLTSGGADNYIQVVTGDHNVLVFTIIFTIYILSLPKNIYKCHQAN